MPQGTFRPGLGGNTHQGRPGIPGVDDYAYQQYLQNIRAPQQDFTDSINSPIPGVSGPTTPMPGQQMPQPPLAAMPPSMSFASPFQATGQYGLLAQQLAGVGGPNMQIPQQPDLAQSMGLLGPRRGFKVPGGPRGK